MTNRLQNELSDEQLDAISGGSQSRDCDDSRGRDNDCDKDGRKRGEHHRKHRRHNHDCRPVTTYNKCG